MKPVVPESKPPPATAHRDPILSDIVPTEGAETIAISVAAPKPTPVIVATPNDSVPIVITSPNLWLRNNPNVAVNTPGTTNLFTP